MPATEGARASIDPCDLDGIARALARSGLILRGGFDFLAGDDAPALADGRAARALALIGAAGADYWRHFEAWRTARPTSLADPLDAWSREVIGAVAERFGATAVAPSDKPYSPFQRWAMRAEGLKPSPLGILIHPRYGLWHAYRGALLFAHRIGFGEAATPGHPCATCRDKPCLDACPVDAHGPDTFDHASCLAHVRGNGGGRCRTAGCFSRNACPVGEEFRYPAAMQAFHMAAFAGLPGGGLRGRL